MKLLNDNWQKSIFVGKWQTTENSQTVVEPATGEPLAEVGAASAEDVANAVARAKEAQVEWASWTPMQRAEVFHKAVNLLADVHEEWAEWLIREIGSTRKKAAFELAFCRDELIDAAAMPYEQQGVVLPDVENRFSFAKRIPFGVVGCVTPFNVPVILGARSIGPALAVGNAVILKPNRASMVCGGFMFGRLFQEAGLPEGVLQVVSGSGVGDVLVEHPDVSMIHFTGSTKVGKMIGENGGKLGKKVSLSMGGNNAFIVLDDADLDAAATNGAYGSFFFSGQSCMSPGRHLVHESVVDDYIDRIVSIAKNLNQGNPFTDDVDAGPMIAEKEAIRVYDWVQSAVDAGATLHTELRREGNHLWPVVVSNVPLETDLYTKETFGPVATIVPFRDDDHAVELANDTVYGLAASVQTRNVNRGRLLAERIHSGNVHVNDPTVMDYAYVPWGGVGDSGNGGRYGRHCNWEEYTEWKWFTIRDEAKLHPLMAGKL